MSAPAAHELGQPRRQFLSFAKKADIRWVAVALYVATLFVELLGVVARLLVLSGLVWLISAIGRFFAGVAAFIQAVQSGGGIVPPIGGVDTAPSAPTMLEYGGVLARFIASFVYVLSSSWPYIVWLITWGPLIASMITLLPFIPGGFFWRKFALEARDPSVRERLIISNALAQIKASSQARVRARYGSVFVIDTPGLEAHAIGNTLYVTAQLIDSNYLTALLAHELGHVNTSDGRLVLALRRLVLLPVYFLSNTFGQVAPGAVRVGASAMGELGCVLGAFVWFFGLLLSLAGGGFSLWLLNLPWAWYWKQREFAADAYTASLGQSGNLIAFLEETKGQPVRSFDITAPYLIIKPPVNETRLDRLRSPIDFTLSVDLRPALALGGALVAVMCVVLAISAVNRNIYRVEGQVWQLTSFCLSAGCDPSSYRNEAHVTSFLGFDNGHFNYQEISSAGVPHFADGTYTYVDKNHIQLMVNQNNGVGYPVGGTYEIRRGANRLTLIGDTDSFEFSTSQSVSSPTSEAVSAATSQSVSSPTSEAVSSPTVKGRWKSAAGEVIFFDENGSYMRTYDGTSSPGTWTVSENTLHINDPSGKTFSYTFTLEGDELTLTPPGGNATKYTRVNE